MYQPTTNQSPEAVPAGSSQSLPTMPLTPVKADASQQEDRSSTIVGSTPMATPAWECQSCYTQNPGRSIQCEACQGTLPVIALFKAQRKYSLSRDYILLSWEVFDADTVVLIPGHEQVPLKGTMEVDPDVGADYQLIATNRIGTKQLATRAKALPPRIKHFTAVDTSIQIGYPIILEWEVDNAARMEIDHGIGEVSGQSYVEVVLESPGTITLTTSNEAGTSTATVEVSLPMPQIHSFYALNDQVELGVPNTLCWEVQNAANIRLISNTGQEIALDRDQRQCDVLTDRNTTYTLVVENDSGLVEQSLDLSLPTPIIHQFAGDSNVSTEGSLVTLSWEVDHAYELRIEPEIGIVPRVGSVKVRPRGAFTVFSLYAKGHSGEAEQSFRIDQFPVPLEESLLLLDEPNLDIMINRNKQKDPADLTPEELQRQRDYQIWRAQQMMLTDELLRMEKASIRREFNKIVKKFKKK